MPRARRAKPETISGRPRRVRQPRKARDTTALLNIDYSKPFKPWWPKPIEKAPLSWEGYTWLASIDNTLEHAERGLVWDGPPSMFYPAMSCAIDGRVWYGFVHRAHRDQFVINFFHLGSKKEYTHEGRDQLPREERVQRKARNRRSRRRRS